MRKVRIWIHWEHCCPWLCIISCVWIHISLLRQLYILTNYKNYNKISIRQKINSYLLCANVMEKVLHDKISSFRVQSQRDFAKYWIKLCFLRCVFPSRRSTSPLFLVSNNMHHMEAVLWVRFHVACDIFKDVFILHTKNFNSTLMLMEFVSKELKSSQYKIGYWTCRKKRDFSHIFHQFRKVIHPSKWPNKLIFTILSSRDSNFLYWNDEFFHLFKKFRHLMFVYFNLIWKMNFI